MDRKATEDGLAKLDYALLITRLVLSVVLIVVETFEIAELLLRYRGVT